MASSTVSIRIKPVTPQNRRDITALQVAPGQENFIESPSQCLEEAAALDLWRPVGLYDGTRLIGFSMYGYFPSDKNAPKAAEGQVWLDRLLIDAACQGKGYGKAAVAALTDRLRQEYGCRRIYLSVYRENTVACRLYQQMGFCFTGEKDTKGELVMAKNLTE